MTATAIEILNDCVFFVGGRGGLTGDVSAGGGCTLAAWNDAGQINQDLSKVMDANGRALSSSLAWGGGSTFPCAVTEHGDGYVRITYASGFTNCRINLAAYAEFDATYSSDRYRVKEQTSNYVVLDLAYSADANCRIQVGGAFDTAQNAWSNTQPGATFNTSIYSNKNQSKTNGNFTATWDIGTVGGSLTNKSFKRFCGFTTQPGDGGQITFDGEDDTAFNPDGGIRFDSAIENVIFENVIVEDAYISWKVTHASVNSIRFINCEGNSGASMGWQLAYGNGCVLIDCNAADNGSYGFDLHYSSGSPNHQLINCIAHGNTKNGFYAVGGRFGGKLLGCIAYDNGNGGTKYSGFSTKSYNGNGTLIDCVAYNNGKHGFELGRANPIAINCIAKDNGQWGFYTDTANPLMASHVAYCCAHGNTSGQFSLPAALPELNSIEQDPLFKDAANGDFRPRNPAVLRGGKLDVKGNPTQMGAILQSYQFARRARAANFGKLQIIR
jgi:hypothetical protein